MLVAQESITERQVLCKRKDSFVEEADSPGVKVDSCPKEQLPAPQVFLGDFPGGSDGKVSAYQTGDPGSVPGLGRSSGEGNGTPLQYSCLENPMDGRVWWVTVHGVARSQTRLSDFTSLYVGKRRKGFYFQR